MLEKTDKDSQEFSDIVLGYYEAKEQAREAEFVRDLNLSTYDIQLLEKEIVLAKACGDFDELQKKGVNVDLSEYLRERGFAEEDIEEVKRIYKFSDFFVAKICPLFSKEETNELFER